MNDYDEHLDPLLDEALGAAELDPALVGRICDLTDGPLLAALDEAVGPYSVRYDHDALVSGILAATSGSAAARPAVIGRIGFGPARSVLRIAAMLALAVGAYAVISLLTGPDAGTQPLAFNPANSVENRDISLDAMEREFAALTDEDLGWTFDRRIALVSAGVEQIRSDTVWAESPDLLVDRAAASADWYHGDDAPPATDWF